MNDLRHEMHERFSAQDEVLAAHGEVLAGLVTSVELLTKEIMGKN